jgi:hypothetical protein
MISPFVNAMTTRAWSCAAIVAGIFRSARPRRLRERAQPLVLIRDLFDTGEVVALRTWTFAITLIQSNTAVAQALICPDARYVAVRWQDGRLDRRHVSPLLWPALEQELARDLATRARLPVEHDQHRAGRLHGRLMVVSFVETQPVTVGRMEDAEKVLDAATRFSQPV